MTQSLIRNNSLLMIVACFWALATGCKSETQQSKETKQTEIQMNENSTNQWRQFSAKVLTGEADAVGTINGEEIEVNRGNGLGTERVTRFSLPNSNATWLGPAQDYYVELDSEIIGLTVDASSGASIQWTKSLSNSLGQGLNLDQGQGLQSTLAELLVQHTAAIMSDDMEWTSRRMSELENETPPASMGDLKNSWTDLGEHLSDFFFMSREFESVENGENETSVAQFDGEAVRIDITNLTTSKSAVVWIDVATRQITKSFEDGSQTFPVQTAASVK